MSDDESAIRRSSLVGDRRLVNKDGQLAGQVLLAVTGQMPRGSPLDAPVLGNDRVIQTDPLSDLGALRGGPRVECTSFSGPTNMMAQNV